MVKAIKMENEDEEDSYSLMPYRDSDCNRKEGRYLVTDLHINVGQAHAFLSNINTCLSRVSVK